MIAPKARRNNKAVAQGSYSISAVYCKLFSDTINNHICVLRKQELNNRGDFSCSGCCMARLCPAS